MEEEEAMDGEKTGLCDPVFPTVYDPRSTDVNANSTGGRMPDGKELRAHASDDRSPQDVALPERSSI